jgi:hypothetical protein
LNARTELIPRWGEWYASDLNPPVLLQLRAWFSGNLAPAAHPVGDWYDYVWGRGGMHTNFGLGLPILGIPFHMVARLFGAPGFPDHLRFLVLEAITMALLARALHRLSPPLAANGLTTVVLATLIARRRGLGPRGLLAGVATAALVATLYLVANFIRFGSPWEAGYANIVSQPAVNRLTRWGIEYEKTRILTASKEMFATLFLLEPVATPIVTVAPTSLPASVAPYAVGERWREYYSPTYDLWVFVAWVSIVAAVARRVVRRRLWRRDRDLRGEVATVLGLWALPPSLALFVFYAKAANLVTRYLVDFYPAYAAAMVCVAMVVVDIVRERAPRAVALAHAAIAGVAVLSLSETARQANPMSRIGSSDFMRFPRTVAAHSGPRRTRGRDRVPPGRATRPSLRKNAVGGGRGEQVARSDGVPGEDDQADSIWAGPVSTPNSMWRRRSGSAITSISAILPPDTVKAITSAARPSSTMTAPAVRFTSTGSTDAARLAPTRAMRATRAAPRCSATLGTSDRSTTSGWSTRTRASKSPARLAAKNASTTSR